MLEIKESVKIHGAAQNSRTPHPHLARKYYYR